MNTVVAVHAAPTPTAMVIALSRIDPSQTNPRKVFDKTKLAELTESVKVHGVLQPILVRPLASDAARFELVAGERRFRAAQAAGLEEIMTICRPLSDRETLEIQVIENLQRADLHPLEEAEGYERLLADHDYTVAALADKVGKSAAYVYARLKLCTLTAANRKRFYGGKLNPTTALLLARIPVPALQDKAGKEITEEYGDPMGTQSAIQHVHRHYMLALKDAPFPCGDVSLVEGAGTCAACPKRTGNEKELFGDVKSADTCTDPNCFGSKRDAHAARQRAAAEKNGQKVITGAEAKKVLPYESSSGNDGWIRLDAKCYEDKKNRSYRAILGKAAPVPALIQLESGAMVEVVRVSEISATLKAKGIKQQERSSHGNKDKAREKAAQLETTVRTAIFTAVRERYPSTLDRDTLHSIAACWLDHCGSDSQRAICKLWGWKYGDYKDREKITANLTPLDAKGLIALLLDLTLIGDVKCHTYSTSKGERLMATAKRVKVDAAKIRAEITKAAKAAVAAKVAKKPAPKKPAAKK